MSGGGDTTKSPASIFRTGRWSITLALFTALVGTALSFYARERIAQSEVRTAQLTAETLRQHTEQELRLFIDVLESVRALHALSGAVNQPAMDEFIEKGLVHQHAVLGAFGLIQQITPELRAAIERKQSTGPGAYAVVESDAAGRWVEAAPRSVYYPLTWQSHPGALPAPIGFDFGSDPTIRATIEHINRTRHSALVPTPFTTDPAPSYWVLAPITPNPATPFVIGFSVAILMPQQILKKVTALSVHAPQLDLQVATKPLQKKISFRDNAWVVQQPLIAGGVPWRFECIIPVAPGQQHSAIALLFGLLITTLMSALLGLLAGRTRRIEAKVASRTRELQQANRQLEESISERAQMEEEMSELAARERRQIGRDLHDSLGQKLTGAVFLSRFLLNHIQPRDRGTAAHAQTLNETLKSAVGQVRELARGLASVTLNDERLAESLEQLAEEMSALYSTPCSADCPAALPTLSRKVKEQIYFIAREAVNNAARHARAQHITIRLTGNSNHWTLQVEDDGCGISEQRESREGMGLRTMSHRAVRLGATFDISSSPTGTIIAVSKSGE